MLKFNTCLSVHLIQMLDICPFCPYHGSNLERHVFSEHHDELGTPTVEDTPEPDWEALDERIDDLLYDVFVGGPYQRQVPAEE